ncbi:hypothetical protein [Burkholderia gladioli]|uniref:hypothetical protein n=1 Tax=Burkholderia gladioli TaxID=28095 RepID=UPI0016406034|nr:hypothetical protein [Burkholderia gladioli]
MLQQIIRRMKPATPAPYRWDLKQRANPELASKIRFAKLRRRARAVFRWSRNGLAILGCFFIYLLAVGFHQYAELERTAAGSCVISRCT